MDYIFCRHIRNGVLDTPPGASCLRRRVRSEPAGLTERQNRQGGMGQSSQLDSHGSHQAGRYKRSLDDRGRKPQFPAPPRRHEGISATGNRDHRRRLSSARLHAKTRKWPQRYVPGRPQVVPGIFRSGRGKMNHYIRASLFFGLFLSGTGFAQPAPNNYADDKSWLCRPGRSDVCEVDLTTTIILENGNLTRERWNADPNAPIDCFYVYPTVSTDLTPNSDMVADPAELNVIRQQFARFASKCRPYAPMYRQITLAGLRRALAAGGVGGAGALASGIQYDDVRDAWNYYLDHDNKGRGFVLVGHSQGSFILAELVRREIDGKPVQSRMVSAILLGTTLAVPRGKDVGGAFQHVPLCHSASQTGCVISYASFRSTLPPPANTRFGKVTGQNMAAACTNPAALGGGVGELHPYLSMDGRTITGTTPPKPWVVPERPINTPWVSVPGL